MYYADNILFVYIIIMYMNQLIISFVLFAFLVYVTTLPKKQENFYSTQNFTNPNYTSNMKYDNAALYYHPNHPYYQPKRGPLPQNNCNRDTRDDDITVYNDVYTPMVAKNDGNTIKCMFCLLLVGMMYMGYSNGYFNMGNKSGSSVFTAATTATSSSR